MTPCALRVSLAEAVVGAARGGIYSSDAQCSG